MTEEQFVEESGLKTRELKKSDVDHYYNTFIDKVEPYLELINHWRYNEKMSVAEIRNVLGITITQWQVFGSMDTVKEYTSKSGHYMMARTQKDFIDAKKDNPHNAKFHDMAFKRFDSGFGDKGQVNVNIPERIQFSIGNEKMEDAQIESKAKGEE